MTSGSKDGEADDSNLVPEVTIRERVRSVLAALIDELARCGAAQVHEGMSVWAHDYTNAQPPASNAREVGQALKASSLHPRL